MAKHAKEITPNALEPGAIMSMAFASECEGMRLAMAVKSGNITLDHLIEVIQETTDPEPRLALGWLDRWEADA